ncbi:MAG: hypothetical protein ACOX5F_07005 [Anaerovoracaceae bacterium]|jgi:hypothetical protein
MKKFRNAVIILTLLGVLAGCSKTDNLNNVELLNTSDVVDLLGENGSILTKVTDFPLDLSLCKVFDEEPQPYLSSKTGVYYMFYEYEGYSEVGNLARQGAFYDYPESNKEFSDFVMPVCTGKNLYVCLWYSERNFLGDTMNEDEKETFDSVMQERSELIGIITEKAFNKKTVTLTGKGDYWEVKMPVKYINNQRKNEKGITETVFYAKGETYLKYLKGEDLPDVTSMSWSYRSTGSTTVVDEGSILNNEMNDGFYRASGGIIRDFNPELDNNIIVKITWNNGKTEETTCTISQTN